MDRSAASGGTSWDDPMGITQSMFAGRRPPESATPVRPLRPHFGSRAMAVEGRKSHYGTSTASPKTKDAVTGEIHPNRVADIAIGAQVADALPNIDWVMPMGSSQDVPPEVADLYEFEAVVTHTTKPIVFIGYTPRGVELVYEMAAEVAGGLEHLQQKPFLIFYPEPISPLVLTGRCHRSTVCLRGPEYAANTGTDHSTRCHGARHAGRGRCARYCRGAHVPGFSPAAQAGMPLRFGVQFRDIRYGSRSVEHGSAGNEPGPRPPRQRWRNPSNCPPGVWPGPQTRK